MEQEINERLHGLTDGESYAFHDKFNYDYDLPRIAESVARNGWGFYWAFGRTKLRSDAFVMATRKGDRIRFDGYVVHNWADKYDFEYGQPGSLGALWLQENDRAKPFPFGATWGQDVRGTIDIRNGVLMNPKFKWTDINDPIDPGQYP